MRVVNRAVNRIGEPVVELVDDNGEPVAEVSMFLGLLVAKDYSPNTVRAYAFDLLKLFRFFDDGNLAPAEFTPARAVEFLTWLRQSGSTSPAQRRELGVVRDSRRQLSGRTCNRVLAAVSSFYEFLISCEQYSGADNPILRQVDQAAQRVPSRQRSPLLTSADQRPIRRVLRVRTTDPLPRPVPDDVFDALLAQLSKLRDRALLELMREGGLRPGEALGLHLDDISYSRRRITVRHRDDHPRGVRQKSRRDRVVDLFEDRALPAVNRYVMLERPPEAPTGLVFLVGGRGRRRDDALSYDALVRMFARAAQRAGVRDAWLTPHSLRHTHATRMSELGMRELTLMARLGHASPDSVQVYTRVTDREVLAEYRQALEGPSS